MIGWIVIGWLESDRVYESTDTVRIDLGERPGWREVLVPKTVVWRSNGTAADVVKAQAHCDQIDGARVFTYSASVEDPLGEAKRALRI